jgi:GNAT superfamily N-acetyltransferase
MGKAGSGTRRRFPIGRVRARCPDQWMPQPVRTGRIEMPYVQPALSSPPAYCLRAYRLADRQTVRSICIATAWMGRPAPEYFGDGWLWAEIWTAYFTDHEPQHTWVVAHQPSNRIGGYLTGTVDARLPSRFLGLRLPWLALGALARGCLGRATQRKVLRGMFESHLRHEYEVSADLQREYPATCHLNLLPAARGLGLGTRLLELFIETMRARNVPGVHIQMLSENVAVARLSERLGFRLVRSRPLRAFAHVYRPPLAICTCVLGLGGTDGGIGETHMLASDGGSPTAGQTCRPPASSEAPN